MTDPGKVGSHFSSLTRMRAVHRSLMNRYGEVADNPQDDEKLLDDIESFLQRGQATGALLFVETDRVIAQGLLDYWAITMYRAGREVPDATLVEFDPSLAPEPKECPYVGLDAFQPHQHHYFFGREELIKNYIARLKQNGFLAIVGPSGSGKSSLALAALLPKLKDGALDGSREWVYCPPVVPGSDPLRSLALAFRPGDVIASKWEQDQTKGFLRDPAHLGRLMDGGQGPTLLLIDQFEELFTLCLDPKVQEAFVNQLLGVIRATDQKHVVILTMRVDFVDYVARLDEFRRSFEAAMVHVPPLGEKELRDAIRKPAEAVELRFDEGLVDALVKDILGQPAGLPLLQFTLLKLWEKRDRNRITWEAYKRLGGARQALGRSADEFYRPLPQQDKLAVKRIFLEMVHAEKRFELTSKRIRRDQLYQVGLARDRIDTVLDNLIQARLVRLTRGDLPADDQVEVAHEALVRNWDRLVEKWLVNEWASIHLRSRLTAAAGRWQAAGREAGELLRGPLLKEAERCPNLGEPVAEYVRASREAIAKEEKDKKKQQEKLTQAWAKAEAERKWARKLRFALSSQMALHSRMVQQAHPERSLLLAVEALKVTRRVDQRHVPAAEEALRNALANSGGTSLRVHRAPVSAVAVSPDHRWLVTGSEDGTASLWDRADLASKPIALKGHEAWISALAISPDSRWLVTSSGDNTARVWDLTDPGAASEALRGHEGEIRCVAISPDGRWLVTGSKDKTARLWDLTDLKADPIVLRGHKDTVWAMAISRDSHWLVTGAEFDTVRRWDLTHPDDAEAALFRSERGGRVRCVAISPNGHWLVTGSENKTVRLRDLNDPGAEPQPLRGHTWGIRSVAFSPDNRWLATGSDDHTVRLWDLANPDASSNILRGHTDAVWAVAFSPDNQRLVTAGGDKDRTIRIWDPREPGVAPLVLRGHESGVRVAAITGDSRCLLTGSNDTTARFWDLARPTPQPETLRGHVKGIRTVAVSPDKTWIATGSDDSTVRLWKVDAFQAAPTVLRGHEQFVGAMAFSPDGRWLVTAGQDKNACLWDMLDLEAGPVYLQGHEWEIHAVAISSNGQWIATGSEDHTTRLWRLTDPASSPVVLGGHEDAVWTVAISPDNHWVVTGSADNTARIWDLTDPAAPPRVLRGHEDLVWKAVISADSRWLVTVSKDKTARLWDLQDPAIPGVVLAGHEGPVSAAAISRDNRWLATATACSAPPVRLWNLTDLTTEPRVLHGHEGTVRAVAISSDNRCLITGGDDKTARIWDLTDPDDAPVVLRGHEESISDLAISADSHWLVTAAKDKTARVWNLRLDELTELACRTAGRNLTRSEWHQYLPKQPYRKTCPRLTPPASLGK